MPFFQLSETDKTFPPAHFADEEGMIAVGGDLSPERLINAYGSGIYFWFGPMDLIKWWSPDPRVVLFTDDVQVDDPVFQNTFRITFDEAFEPLMRACQEVQNKKPMNENWITEEMTASYLGLSDQGKAHSAEVWEDENLIGGVFGISIGRLFFAEYLLGKDILADTYALQNLALWLGKNHFPFIDLQKITEDLGEIEISEISRLEFLDLITKNKETQDLPHPWKLTSSS